MSITLDSATVAERIQERVARGDYADADEVVTRALDALEYQENLRLVRHLIDEARESDAKHGSIPMTPTLFDEIFAAALQANRRGDPVPDYLKG